MEDLCTNLFSSYVVIKTCSKRHQRVNWTVCNFLRRYLNFCHRPAVNTSLKLLWTMFSFTTGPARRIIHVTIPPISSFKAKPTSSTVANPTGAHQRHSHRDNWGETWQIGIGYSTCRTARCVNQKNKDLYKSSSSENSRTSFTSIDFFFLILHK
jgi:hypothetical protein